MKNRFFNGLLICILGACIIPSIVTITVYYRDVSGKTVDSAGRSNIITLEQISAYMDDLVYNMTTMPKVHKSYADASLISETHFGDCITSVYRLFRGLSEIPDKIDVSFLYSFKLNYALGIFSKKNGPMLQYFPELGAGYAQLCGDIYTKSTLIKTSSDDNQECILMATPVRSTSYNMTGTIFTGTYIQTIKNDLSAFIQEYTGNVAVYSRDAGILFFMNDNDENFFNEIKALTGSRSGYITADTSRGKYLITAKISGNTGFEIISFIPLSLILNGLNPVNYYSLYVILMFAVLALIAGIFALRIIYKPLGSLVNYAQTLDEGDNAKNEILVIKNALNSLNSSKQSLSAIIRDNRYILEYRKFCEFIFGHTQNENSGYNFSRGAGVIVAMAGFRISAKEDDGDYYKTLRSLQIAEYLDSQFSATSYKAKILQTYKNEIIIVFGDITNDEKTARGISDILTHRTGEIKSGFPDITAMNTGVGIFAREPSMINESYFQARRAMENAKLSGEFNVFFFGDYTAQKDSVDLLSFENRLIKLLAAKKTEDIYLIIDEITSEAAKTPGQFTFDKLYDFFVRMIFESILSFSQINPKIAQALSQKSYISDFNRTENLMEKNRWLKSFYSEIIAVSTDPENNPALLKNKLKTACEYIRENYSRLITLNDIAQKVNLNPSYFSTAFRTQMGQTFTDYINKLRIEEAKQFLQTNRTIPDISRTVGYVSVYQLNRFFRKYEKITPAQYRENFRLDGNC
ncbi:MAG: AraC family transcriptional regulator [Treponema sp.]|nr:AraC family transcriptional regulator [Treponema sp.]